MANPSLDEKDPRQQLLETAALILEQEGWLLGRMVYEGGVGRRILQFSERYREWQDQVQAYRTQHPGAWPEPLDNS